jgi:hypothetical protein
MAIYRLIATNGFLRSDDIKAMGAAYEARCSNWRSHHHDDPIH